jgi:UDP:flavonoid glycosyltransferase YjiC (YdhE family)
VRKPQGKTTTVLQKQIQLRNINCTEAGLLFHIYEMLFTIADHPNVRAFLSHGGLLGTIEAVHAGVPMIGSPMYGDQGTNMKMVESAGMAVILQYNDITKENVLKAIRTVLDNPRCNTTKF